MIYVLKHIKMLRCLYTFFVKSWCIIDGENRHLDRPSSSVRLGKVDGVDGMLLRCSVKIFEECNLAESARPLVRGSNVCYISMHSSSVDLKPNSLKYV